MCVCVCVCVYAHARVVVMTYGLRRSNIICLVSSYDVLFGGNERLIVHQFDEIRQRKRSRARDFCTFTFNWNILSSSAMSLLFLFFRGGLRVVSFDDEILPFLEIESLLIWSSSLEIFFFFFFFGFWRSSKFGEFHSNFPISDFEFLPGTWLL